MGVAVESYEQARAAHRWDVPARYNIAADVCDKHPRGKLAMVHEDPDGNVRELTWGDMQDMSSRFARRLLDAGDAARRPGGHAAAADPGGRGRVPRGLEGGRHPPRRCPCCTATTASATACATARPRFLVTDAANRARVDADLTEQVIELSPGDLDEGSTDVVVADTAADDPAQLYYTSGTTGLAKGILHAHRYLLAHEEFTYCHDVSDGVRFRGMGEWAWAAGIAPLLGPWRLGAVQVVVQRTGGFDPSASSTRCRATASPTSSRRRRRCAR